MLADLASAEFQMRMGPLNSRLRAKRGQTLVEYALIIAFVAIVAIAVLMSTGSSIQSAFTTVNTQAATAQRGGPSAGRGP